jgi:Rieske Fe-S protein
MSCTKNCTRRSALVLIGKSALAAAVAGCSRPDDESLSDSGADAGPEATCNGMHGGADEGWLALALADYPSLAPVGGFAYVNDPTRLLNVVLVRHDTDCFSAVWRICTHGACEVEYAEGAEHVECPCHGSQFGLDGTVLRGPASAALKAFPVVRDADTLWLRRWA